MNGRTPLTSKRSREIHPSDRLSRVPSLWCDFAGTRLRGARDLAFLFTVPRRPVGEHRDRLFLAHGVLRMNRRPSPAVIFPLVALGR
jgi:hypothetical protein